MKIRTPLFIALPFLLLLTACPRCPETITIDHGPLPDEALQYVPYHTGETYRFKHSRDRVVNFTVQRNTFSQEFRNCGECCDNTIRYESNFTEMTPDYPLFNIHLEISNIDTSFYFCTAMVGGSGFIIPTNGPDAEEAEKADSVLVDSIWYHDVYKINFTWGNSPGEEIIYADSIWYNYTDGILKIIMSNEEYYELTKE